MGSAALIIGVNAIGTVNVTESALSVIGDGSALVNVASIAGHMLPKFLVPRRSYNLARSDPEKFTAKLVAYRGLGTQAHAVRIGLYAQ